MKDLILFTLITFSGFISFQDAYASVDVQERLTQQALNILEGMENSARLGYVLETLTKLDKELDGTLMLDQNPDALIKATQIKLAMFALIKASEISQALSSYKALPSSLYDSVLYEVPHIVNRFNNSTTAQPVELEVASFETIVSNFTTAAL